MNLASGIYFLNFTKLLVNIQMRQNMTDGTKNALEKDYENFLQYMKVCPEELLILFKQFAPRILN